MLDNPESGWVAFYSFPPMTFLFVGFAFIVAVKRMQALEDRLKAIEGGGPPLDTTGNSTELDRLRFAPLIVGGMLILLLTINGGWHGSVMRQVVLSLAYSAIVAALPRRPGCAMYSGNVSNSHAMPCRSTSSDVPSTCVRLRIVMSRSCGLHGAMVKPLRFIKRPTPHKNIQASSHE